MSILLKNQLYVGNLSATVTESALRDLFSAHGPVSQIEVVIESAVGRSRGFAYVAMETPEAARAAIKSLHCHQLGGRYITVNEARPAAAPRAGTLIGEQDFQGFGRRA